MAAVRSFGRQAKRCQVKKARGTRPESAARGAGPIEKRHVGVEVGTGSTGIIFFAQLKGKIVRQFT